MPTESIQSGLFGVLYMMYYVNGDLYSPDLFHKNFCEAFRKKYQEKHHQMIREALAWAMENPDYAYEDIYDVLKQKYSRKDMFYYLSEFHKRLVECK